MCTPFFQVGGSPLSLLVLRILADDHDVAVPLDNLALFADFLDGRLDFHSYTTFLCFAEASRMRLEAQLFVRQVILPLDGS